MAAYYLDSSALVKRYFEETGTRWVSSLTNPVAGHDIFMIRITGPEVVAAFFRKVKSGDVDQNEAVRAADRFKVEFRARYHVLELNEAIADSAMTLAQLHFLRGYDSVQLAAALILQSLRLGRNLNPVFFVSADDNLNKAAASEGLTVDNPNDY